MQDPKEPIWNLSIEDLFVVTPGQAALASTGPFVINLRSSSAPTRMPHLPGFDHLQAYRISDTEHGRPRFRVRLGFFDTRADADSALGTLRDEHTTAFVANVEDADLAHAPKDVAARVRAIQAEAAKAAHAMKPTAGSSTPELDAAIRHHEKKKAAAKHSERPKPADVFELFPDHPPSGALPKAAAVSPSPQTTGKGQPLPKKARKPAPVAKPAHPRNGKSTKPHRPPTRTDKSVEDTFSLVARDILNDFDKRRLDEEGAGTPPRSQPAQAVRAEAVKPKPVAAKHSHPPKAHPPKKPLKAARPAPAAPVATVNGASVPQEQPATASIPAVPTPAAPTPAAPAPVLEALAEVAIEDVSDVVLPTPAVASPIVATAPAITVAAVSVAPAPPSGVTADIVAPATPAVPHGNSEPVIADDEATIEVLALTEDALPPPVADVAVEPVAVASAVAAPTTVVDVSPAEIDFEMPAAEIAPAVVPLEVAAPDILATSVEFDAAALELVPSAIECEVKADPLTSAAPGSDAAPLENDDTAFNLEVLALELESAAEMMVAATDVDATAGNAEAAVWQEIERLAEAEHAADLARVEAERAAEEERAAETARREAERLETERVAEAARVEVERIAEAARLEAERIAEAERVAAAARAEALRIADEERAAAAAARAQAERFAEEARLAEAARLEAERILEVERAAAAAARAEAERFAEEARRAEAARLEAERAAEAARLEAARIAEAARLEAERIAEEARRAETARLEAERAAEAQRVAEAERVAEAARRAEAERVAEEARRAEAERIVAEMRRADAKRLAEEARRAEAARVEAERLAAETRRAETARAEAARAEAARAEAARVEAARVESERAGQATRLAAAARVAQPKSVAQAPVAGTAAAPASRPADSLDSTQTLRLITQAELADADASKWFAVQLAASDKEPNLDKMPELEIFAEYQLYTVNCALDGRMQHVLRLGFFGNETGAQAVAAYMQAFFESPTISRVSLAEHERFSRRKLKAPIEAIKAEVAAPSKITYAAAASAREAARRTDGQNGSSLEGQPRRRWTDGRADQRAVPEAPAHAAADSKSTSSIWKRLFK